MSDNINNMDFKQLRNEVQLLRDELAIMKRKYEDIIYNLDTDNFSSRFVKEQGNMRTAIEINAEGIKTKVSKEDLESSITQTAESITSIVSKGANLDKAEEISSIEEATNTDAIYVIKEYATNENGDTVVKSETYYYFNDFSKSWEELSGDSIYTVFEQTDEGFALKGNVLIDGNAVITKDLTLSGTVTWDMINSPVKSQYSKNGSIWHDEYTSGDKFMRMTFDGGKSWGEATKIVGDDADLTFTKVNETLGYLYKKANGEIPTTVNSAYIYAPEILGGSVYGTAFYAGGDYSGEPGYSCMDKVGLTVWDENGDAKLGMGYIPAYNFDDDKTVNHPYISLGVGSGNTGNGAGAIFKYGNGLWIGTSDDSFILGGEEPKISEASKLTGIFIDFYYDKIYKYINGVPTEL